MEEPNIHVGVMGAGAVGCYVGTRLLAQGIDVTFVGRPRLQASVEAEGLSATSVNGSTKSVAPEACRIQTDVEALRDCNVVLVCVKSGDTEATARALGPVLRPRTVVVSLQNGVSNARRIREVFQTIAGSHHSIVAGIVHFNVVAKESTHFVQTTDGEISLGEPEGAGAIPSFDRLVDAMRAADLSPQRYSKIEPEQYAKLVVNLNNAVVSLSGQPTAAVLQDAGYRRLIADVVEEALEVFRQAGVDVATFRGVPLWLMPKIFRLPTALLRPLLRTRLKVAPDARPSMWDDLSRQRRTEVDELNGEIVRLADLSGAAAPLNRRLVEWIRVVEQAQSLPRAIPAPVFRGFLHRETTPTENDLP